MLLVLLLRDDLGTGFQPDLARCGAVSRPRPSGVSRAVGVVHSSCKPIGGGLTAACAHGRRVPTPPGARSPPRRPRAPPPRSTRPVSPRRLTLMLGFRWTLEDPGSTGSGRPTFPPRRRESAGGPRRCRGSSVVTSHPPGGRARGGMSPVQKRLHRRASRPSQGAPGTPRHALSPAGGTPRSSLCTLTHRRDAPQGRGSNSSGARMPRAEPGVFHFPRPARSTNLARFGLRGPRRPEREGGTAGPHPRARSCYRPDLPFPSRPAPSDTDSWSIALKQMAVTTTGRSTTGKYVSRAAATGPSRSHRGKTPANWSIALVVILVLGLASVAFSRYEYAKSTASAKPATWYAGLSLVRCGAQEAALPASSAGDGVTTPGSGVLATSLRDKSQATLGRFVDHYPGLVLDSDRLQVPGHRRAAKRRPVPSGNTGRGQGRRGSRRFLVQLLGERRARGR